MIEHCVSAFSRKRKSEIYRMYVTDALKVIAENTAKFAGGSVMSKRYEDIINPPPEETRTADEIVESIRNTLAQLR